jgi:glycosyltransferase involved in cell wall biosynthesis
MRLAFVADAQSPNTRSFLGAFVEQGHEVHLLSLHHTDSVLDGVTTHFLSTRPLLPKSLYITRWPTVRRWIHQIDPDLVVAYRVTGNGLLAALAGGRPLIVVPTGTDVLGLNDRSATLRRIVRYVLRKADGVLCWAPHMARAVLELRGMRGIYASSGPWTTGFSELPVAEETGYPHGSRPTLLLIQPRGIDRRLFAARPEPRPSERRVITLVTTRALKSTYGHEQMVRAMMHLQGSQPRLRLVLTGGGPDAARLRELASNLGVADQIDFLGPVPHHEIPQTLAEGSFYVSLIDHDGVSASMLEAMSVGLYPIVRDCDAARVWIRDGWNGSLVKDDHPEPVARLIRRLTVSSDLREETVMRNWNLIEERADLTKNTLRIADWFQEVLACHNRPSRSGRKVA